MAEITLHPLDITGQPGAPTARYWRSTAQLLYHLREFLPFALPLARVYLLHALPPSFRERLMLVTADANGCPW